MEISKQIFICDIWRIDYPFLYLITKCRNIGIDLGLFPLSNLFPKTCTEIRDKTFLWSSDWKRRRSLTMFFRRPQPMKKRMTQIRNDSPKEISVFAGLLEIGAWPATESHGRVWKDVHLHPRPYLLNVGSCNLLLISKIFFSYQDAREQVGYVENLK